MLHTTNVSPKGHITGRNNIVIVCTLTWKYSIIVVSTSIHKHVVFTHPISSWLTECRKQSKGKT